MMKHEERRYACPTDTQHIVNLSAYHWAMDVLGGFEQRRVLDAACGTGYGSDVCAPQARFVVGVDFDEHTIDEANGFYGRPNLYFLSMDCRDLALRREGFDVVLSFETLEHLEDDRQFLREVKRVLTPQGVFVISTPHGEAPGATPQNPFHHREYAWDEFGTLLSDHFQSVRTFGRRLSPRLAHLELEMNSVRRFDPGGLRRLLPRRLRHALGSFVSRNKGGVGLAEVTIADVEYCEGLRETSTLLAICQRAIR